MQAPIETDAIVFAGLLPHAPILVPGVGPADYHVRCSHTISAMLDVARQTVAALPDVVVLISPHSPQRPGSFGLWRTPVLHGSFEQFGARDVHFELPLDTEFCERLDKEARERKLATWSIEEGGLDHGAAVPLYYLIKAGWKSPTVVVGLTSSHTEQLEELGRAIAATAAALDRRVAVIASGDMSHRLSVDAPCGYHEDGARFDHAFIRFLRSTSAEALSHLDARLVSNAAEDVVDSTWVALSASDRTNAPHEVLSYEGPFGVGYGVAVLAENKVVQPKPGKDPARKVVLTHRADLPRVARQSVSAYLANPSSTDTFEAGGNLIEPHGVFVSLHLDHGELRGCSGSPFPGEHNLVEETWRLARVAAFDDPRFSPLRQDELIRTRFSVSILNTFEPAASPADLNPALYGVFIQARDGRRSLLLPAIDGIDTVEEQLRAARRKAGIPPGDEIEIRRFTAPCFSEPPVLKKERR